MKNRDAVKKILVLALCAALMVAFASSGLADAGNFVSDVDWGEIVSDIDTDTDWGSSSGSDFMPVILSTGDDSGIGWVVMLIVLLLILLILSIAKKKKASGQSGHATPLVKPTATPKDISALVERDPNFSQSAFLDKVGNMYVQMQDCWESKQWEPMRMLLTDSLYNQLDKQLDELRKSGHTNHIDKISVMNSSITDYYEDDVNDTLKVQLVTRIIDYVTDDKTGKLIRGDKALERFMTYEWTLIRSRGVLTPEPGQQPKSINCKNCGAAMDINHSARCPYCGAVASASEYDWVLSSIRGISQQSGR